MRNTILDLECVPCPEAAEFLERKPRPEFLPLVAPGNYKKPESIAQYLAENAASHQAKYEQSLVEWEADWQQQIADCGLDPDLCEIAALGVMIQPFDPVILTRDQTTEAEILREFWDDHNRDRLIGYAILNYDLLVLMRRSDYLGVKYAPLNIDRHRTEHVDLQQRLWFNGAHRYAKGKSLKFYNRRFHLGVPDDDEDGDKVWEWYQAGNFAAISLHLRRDLERTKALAERLGYWTPQARSLGKMDKNGLLVADEGMVF